MCQRDIVRILKTISSVLLIVIVLLYVDKQLGARQLKVKFGIPDLPSDLEIENYEFSGFGMDHHFLWMVVGKPDGLLKLIDSLGVKLISKSQSSPCLSLLKEQAPGWWPVPEIEDRLWQSSRASMDLYSATLPNGGLSCVFVRQKSNVAYIQWFDT